MQSIAIFGSSGFARETHQIIRDLNKLKNCWEFLGFLDDDELKHGTLVHGFPVIGGADWLRTNPEVNVLVAIGSPRVKRAVVKRLMDLGHERFATLIHPTAWIGDDVRIGHGTVICAGVRITCDISIGSHVIVNLDATIGHDSIIDDFATIAPSANISGAVHLGSGVDIGTNATVIQGISIGEWSIIGAGAVVVRDIPRNVTAVGMPAKCIKELESAENVH